MRGAELRHLFRHLPEESGHNKRLGAAASMIRYCNNEPGPGDTTVWTDDVRVVYSTRSSAAVWFCCQKR